MKISKKAKQKVLSRYHNKCAEYSVKTKEEIKELLEKVGKKELKLSSTDLKALWDSASFVMQREREQTMKNLEIQEGGINNEIKEKASEETTNQ